MALPGPQDQCFEQELLQHQQGSLKNVCAHFFLQHFSQAVVIIVNRISLQL